jgi:hypothetical protein
MLGFDVEGFFTSTDFLSRLALFVTALISAFVGEFVTGLLATG